MQPSTVVQEPFPVLILFFLLLYPCLLVAPRPSNETGPVALILPEIAVIPLAVSEQSVQLGLALTGLDDDRCLPLVWQSENRRGGQITDPLSRSFTGQHHGESGGEESTARKAIRVRTLPSHCTRGRVDYFSHYIIMKYLLGANL